MGQQPALDLLAKGESGHRTVTPDHAVTRHNQGNGIGGVGTAHRAGGAGITELRGELAHLAPGEELGAHVLLGDLAVAGFRQRIPKEDLARPAVAGQAAIEESLEVVNLRLVLTAARADTIAEAWMSEPWVPTDKFEETSRDVVFADADKPLKARILWRPALPAGFTFEGPAVIEEPNSTILIHPGDKVTVTDTGHLLIDLHYDDKGEA